ncbi:hypothetical protein ACWGJV_38575 [Streptomyces tendae]
MLRFDGCATRHHRLSYLDVPAEIQTEAGLAPDGALRLVVTSRSAAVAGLITALPSA